MVPVIYASVDTLSSRHLKGRVTSVLSLTENMGYFLGPLVAGLAAHFLGFQATFFGFGMFIVCIMFIAFATRFQKT